MMTRRKFLAGIAAAAAQTGCSRLEREMAYELTVDEIYRHPRHRRLARYDAARELVRYATMAANSHNTQPWKFHVNSKGVRILPDFSRRCPVVDPDDHHLFASLGCAAENFVTAAEAFGLHADLCFEDAPEPSIAITLDSAPARTTRSFLAIPQRQCTRRRFTGQDASVGVLEKLGGLAYPADIELRILTGDKHKRALTDFVVAGNSAQMDDDAFVEELGRWIRFNEEQAFRHWDGLTFRSVGSPPAPEWLGRLLFKLMFNKRRENQKYRDQIASSAAVVIFSCAQQSKAQWVEVGRAYQRFALHSTTLGLRHAFINQPIEVPEQRSQLASYLNLGERLPDLVVRFGYGEPTPRTLRRPVESVLVLEA